MEKRTKDRITKRLLVRYGTECCDREAVTGNVSSAGIFVRSSSGLSPQTRIRLELMLPDGREIRLEGKVVWTKKAPTYMSQQAKSGMGISLNPAGAEFGLFTSMLDTMRGEA